MCLCLLCKELKIPIYIAQEINSANRNVFWKNKIDSDNVQGLNAYDFLEKFCRLKCEGGLDIRKIKDINASSFAKLGWKVITEPEYMSCFCQITYLRKFYRDKENDKNFNNVEINLGS